MTRLATGHFRQACVFVVAIATGLTSCSEPDVAAPVSIDRVVLIGDSLGEQTAPYLQQMVGALAFDSRVFGGTAPCDWLGKDLAVTPTAVAVISFIGNSSSACMADGAGEALHGQALVDKYRSDVTALIAQVRGVGARVLMVGQPQRLGVPDDDVEQTGLNTLYASLVEPGAVEFVDAGATVEDANGAFALRLACIPGETQCDPDGSIAVRSDDGVHFCATTGAAGCADYSSGAFRFAAAIVTALNLG